MCVVNELTNSSDCVNEKKYLQNELAKKGQNYDAVVPVEMSEREHEFLVTREQVQSHGGRSSLITIGQNKHSVAAVCVCVCGGADSVKNCTRRMPLDNKDDDVICPTKIKKK